MTTPDPRAIPESTVAAVVNEVSGHMKNPQYAELAVGDFVTAHPDAGRFISAQAKELGGSEAVVHVIFHAQVLAECFRKHRKRRLAPVTFPVLNRHASKDCLGTLAKVEPALHDYLAANVDEPRQREAIAHLALAMNAQR